MTDPKKRIIKKYPNRRLYDTELSLYITFEEIKEMVVKNIPFKIIDSKTQEDLTNNTLLQIVMELEQKGAPIFTTVILEQIIRFYGNNYQAMFSQFLEKSLNPGMTNNMVEFWKNAQNQWQEFFKRP
jgi:polyhydroxyalkanoate synthesis repressor PhaR